MAPNIAGGIAANGGQSDKRPNSSMIMTFSEQSSSNILNNQVQIF